jgi:hypothetical protein
MKIERNLNFVIPVERDDGTTVYVHSMPISADVFEQYFLVISKTFARIYLEGLGQTAGPRVAAMLLKDVAMERGLWEGPAGVERGLMNEIRRLSNVVAPGPKGWTTFPFQEAIDQKFLDSSDIREVENALVFFTVASSMHRRQEVRAVLEGAGSLWGAQVESSSSTEFCASLQTSTATANTGGTAAALSVPS